MKDRFFYDIYFQSPELTGGTAEFIFRLNFFFTKLRQKETSLQFIYKEEFTGVYFNHKELGAIFGKNNFKRVIDELVTSNLIQKATLTNQRRSKIYVFKPHSREAIQHRSEIPVFMPKVLNAVNSYYTHKAQELSETGRMQLANLRLTSIDITHGDFMQHVIEHYPCYSQIKSDSGLTPNSQAEYIQAHQYLWNRIADFNSSRGKALFDFVSEDRFGNRFHSIITQIPKFIKTTGAIKLHKQDTIELDLHQSQPCILAHLLEEYDSSNDFSRKFKQEPDIYEYMKERFSLSSRDGAKKMMFTMMFGKPHGKIQQEFSMMFPKAARVIKQIKTTKLIENPSSKIYSNMAYKLQRYESEMFREVWSALNAEKIRFLSVHDSVIVQERHEEQARLIMETVLSHYLTNFKIN